MRVYFNYQSKEYSEEELSKLANTVLFTFFERNKYKVMWSLRSLEKEIDYYEGVIIIDDKNKITMKGFPEEFSDKMFELIRVEFGE